MAAPIIEKPEVTLVNDREADVEKKGQVHLIDNVRVLGLSEEDATFYRGYTPEERRRVIRKVCLLRLFKMLLTHYNPCLLYTSPSPRDRG